MSSGDVSRLVLGQGVGFAVAERMTSLIEKSPMWQRSNVFFMLFAVSVSLSTYTRTVGAESNAFSGLAYLLGGVTCGWAWLFVRSLFIQSSEDNAAPLMVVLFVLALQFVNAAGSVLSGGELNILRMTGNVVGMVGSTFVIITLAEIVRHVPGAQMGPERRFRLLFATGYLVLLIFAVFMVEGASEGTFFATHAETIRSVAALLALGAGLAALRFRHLHPLTSRTLDDQATRTPTPLTETEKRLAKRIEELLREPKVYTQASLKVGDVAARLGEHDYLVSRAITQALGQPNFNRCVNRYRIEQAQKMLSDPQFSDLSILAIALDCGFASIGTFNRAFRETMGMTPSAYRRQNARTR